jgi:predicted solute-binding protein
MAKRSDKKDKNRKKENDIVQDEDNLKSEGEFQEYIINSLEDYFFATRDLFIEFRNFTLTTNKTLTVTLNSLRELIPMIMSGKIDYGRVSKILREVNEVLQKYLAEQERLIAKTTSLNKELKDRNKVQKMMDEYFSRFYFSVPPYEYEKTEKEEKDIKILPSAIFKELDKEKLKEIMEKFGVDIEIENKKDKNK